MERHKCRAASKEVRELFEKMANEIGLDACTREVILGDSDVQLDRMTLFIWVYEESGRLLGDAGLWLKAPNTGFLFNGRTPMAYILEKPGAHLRSTYQYLRGAYGG